MTFRRQLLEQHLEVAPGDTVPIRLEIHNDASSSCDFTIRVVGIDARAGAGGSTALRVTVPAGESAICSVPVSVPATIGTGQHSAALEVASSEVGSRPVLSEFTVSISSLAGLELIPTPSPIRGKRRAKFHVDVVNNEPEPLDFVLTAEANDVVVKFAQPAFSLAPGERSVTAAKLKASPLRRGEPIQHNVLITAQGRASTASTTVPYVQRPLVAHGARVGLAALVLIALWVGAIVGVFAWLDQRQEAADRAAAAQITGVDTDGDGVADVFYDETGMLVASPEAIDRDGDGVVDGHVDGDGDPIPVVTALDTDGDGIADAFVDETGAPVVDPSTGADGSGEPDQIASSVQPEPEATPAAVFRPSVTTFGGTVSAGDESVEDIRIVVAPISLGASDGSGDQVAFAGAEASQPGKIWSARRALVPDGDLTVRQSEAVDPREVAPGVDGVWRIGDVPLGRSYEVSFSKVGFDTQRFVLTPPDDGEPVEIDVELAPAIGLISGRVVGPSGPLGGADITITDGTLVFETTADTDGDIGSFVIERVSTPGVYTLRASLRGFGTEVVQVELDAGEQAGGIEIVMRAGVATVTGRVVDEFGRSLPGASVSATNGVNIRRTSTLTAGDVGFYSLPQLDVPSDYTIDVSLDGYTSQTRRLPIGSSVAGVNFVLERTTSTVSGTVDSAGGGGVVAAGVTLTNGDLEFRTSTTNSPNGFFAVADLPAGNYTVTVEHFEHQTSTEFVTVVEGRDPDPLSITLPLLGDTDDVGTGELVVEVVDPDADNAQEREVAATITLVETRTGRQVPTPTEPSPTVRVVGIAPGTYTLTASAFGYADSAPRQVSIGLQSERREVEVQRLGQASGRMVDSLTDQPVGPYAIELFFVIGNQEVDTGIRVIGQADGTWATSPRALAPGEYRVRVRDEGAPDGYRVVEDQRLDPDASGLMRFIVVGGLDEPNEVLDIEADPFPDITGRIFTPTLIANDTITDLVPIDDASLTAFLRCDGNAAEIEATLTDLVGVVGTDAAPRFDTYTITKEQVDRERLIGNCRVDVSADGFVDATIDLPGLQPSDGFNENDRVANAALYSPTDAIGGTIFWEDPRFVGVPVLLDDVDIATNVVVEFPSTDEAPPPPGNEPLVRREDRSTKSVGGTWVLAGQVFGPATYQITEEGFDATAFEVVIDEARTRTVTANPDITMTPASPATNPIRPGVPYALELENPFDGQVLGRVTILSESATRDYGDVTITAIDPDSNPVTAPDVRTVADDPVDVPDVGAVLDFSFDDAAAGTWDVDFTLPDNHILHTPVAASLRATDRVDPDETQAGFDTTLVDLATVAVSARNANSAAAITSEADIVLTPTSIASAVNRLDDVALPATVEDVVVDVVNPVGTPVSYSLDVNLPGFDPGSARVEVTSGGSSSVVNGRLTGIPVTVVAGRDVTVEVDVLPFGEIFADIAGAVDRRATPTVEPLDVESPTGSGRAEVIVARVSSTGFVIDPDVTNEMLIEPTGTPGRFRVSGPSGFYSFTVSHPEFAASTRVPTDSIYTPPLLGGSGLPSGVFELRNNTPNTLGGRFLLPIRLADAAIDVFEQLGVAPASRVPVVDYTVEMRYQDAAAGQPDYSQTLQNNTQTVPGLLPGAYDLTISAPGRFSFISVVVVSRTELGAPVVTEIAAPLPSVGAIIDGQVEARNSRDELVALPTVTVTRSFGGELGTVTPGASPDLTNTNPGVEPKSVSDPAGQSSFFFDGNVALGTHTVSVTAPPNGYVAPDDQTVLVTQLGPTRTPLAAPFVVRVDDVDVDVQILAPAGGVFTESDFSATLTGPAGTVTGLPVISGGTATVTFSGIAPSLTAYTLQVSDPLYNTSETDPSTGPETTIIVPPNTAGTPTVASVPPTFSPPPGRGVVSGRITQDGSSLVVTGDTEILLTPTGGTAGAPIAIVPTNGDFEISVDTAGDYLLSVDNGLRFTSVVDLAVRVDLGVRTVVPTVDIRGLAKFVVTTTPSSLPTGVVIELERSGVVGRIQPVPSNSLDFYVERDASYRVIVSGTYPETRFPSPTGFYQVGPSATDVTQPITLPRRVEITTNNFPTGLVVELDGQTANASAVPTVFTSPAISANGSLQLRLRVGNAGSDVIISTNVPNELSTILAFDFVDITGDLTVSDGVSVPVGTDITATSGSTILTGAVTAGNRYEIEGLSRNPNNSARDWTVTFDEVGYGQESDPAPSISIAQGSAATRDLPVTIVPAEFDITFDVELVGTNVDVSDTLIDFNGQTGVTTKKFNDIRETQGVLTYTVRHPNGSLSPTTGTIDTARRGDFTTNPPIDMSPANVPIDVGALTGFGTTSVRICSNPGSNTDGACSALSNGGPFTTTATSASFTTSSPITTPGDYFVEVRRVTTEADAAATPPVTEETSERIRRFTVNNDGSVTVGAISDRVGTTTWTISIFDEP